MKNIRVERNGKKLTNEDINYISRMAKSGHTHEQYTLGLVYYYGQGPDVDMEEAKKWLRMAAEKGHSESQYVLGEIHLAEDSAKDIDGAIYWLELASKDANLKIAKELLLKQAYLRYVIIYLMGCTMPNNKTGITEELHELALQIRVQLMLRDYKSSIEGMRSLQGKTKDKILNEYVNKSLVYLTELNEFIGSKDDSGTIQPWGNVLVNKGTGEIITKSKENLFVNKDKAGIVVDASDIRSEQKKPTTISDDDLASDSEENYRKGLEFLTKKDYVKGGKYFFLAAKSGNIKAMYIYGKMLLYGTGVKKNLDEGIRLLQISSDKGYAKAATTLGEVYEKGILVQRDLKKAEELYQKAAELGDEKALQRINNSRKEKHKQER